MSENTIKVGSLSESLGLFKQEIQDPVDMVRTALQSLTPGVPTSDTAITRERLELAHKQNDPGTFIAPNKPVGDNYHPVTYEQTVAAARKTYQEKMRLHEEGRALNSLKSHLPALPMALVNASGKIKEIAIKLTEFAENARSSKLEDMFGIPGKERFEDKLAPLLAA